MLAPLSWNLKGALYKLRLIDWLMEWLIDLWIDWLLDWLIGWLINRYIEFDWLFGWLVDKLIGFTTAEDKNKLAQFLNRTRRMGYFPGDSAVVSEMVHAAEDNLLSVVSANQFHVLRCLFQPLLVAYWAQVLSRSRKHDFVLPPKDEKNFITRVVYSSILNR